MRTYRTVAPIAEPWHKATPPAPSSDTSRGHACNWGAAVGILTLCVGVCAWSGAKALGAHVTAGQLALTLPAAIGAGGVAFAVKLLQFTQEHRAWLYALERATGLDLDGDGTTGEPPGAQAQPKQTIDGALVRGIDGSMHRLDVALSPLEMQAIKRHMLTAGAFGVRAVNTILQDETRASLLRSELHRLGILEQPKPRAATPLTEAGHKAVMRWAA